LIISPQRYGNVYGDEYVDQFQAAVDSSEALGKVLVDAQLVTDYKTDSSLKKQFFQVARLIQRREARKSDRDFFFVDIGGFDTHSGLAQTLTNKFTEINDALEGFVTELQAQKQDDGSTMFDSTVIFTASDFGRTLSYNGQGTDHGWGGNQMIIGGAVRGGVIYNSWLETYEAGSMWDGGRNRVIPKYPYESMMAPIAEWMGVDDPHEVFPNLKHFNDSLIIPRRTLFKN